MRQNPNRKTGVTLVELIMAMVILSVVAIATAAMIGAQIEGAAKSADVVAAGNLARRELERLHNIAYASVANGNTTAGPFSVAWTVVQSTSGSAARKDITMTVTRSGTTLLTVYGTITNNITYATA